MKTKKQILLGILIFTSAVMYSEDAGKRPGVDEMHTRKWQFIVEQAQLTQKEADAVGPIFMEYEKTVWNQHEKNRDFFKSANKKNGNDKPNYSALNDRYAEIELIQGQLFKNYHLKLRKHLQPETLFRYYKAEREFKRKLLQEMPGRPPHDDRP
jgi:hypothetical protein